MNPKRKNLSTCAKTTGHVLSSPSALRNGVLFALSRAFFGAKAASQSAIPEDSSRARASSRATYAPHKPSDFRSRGKPAGPRPTDGTKPTHARISIKPLRPFHHHGQSQLHRRASRVLCPGSSPPPSLSSPSCAFGSAVLGERCARASALRSLAKPYTLDGARFVYGHGGMWFRLTLNLLPF